MKHDDDETGGYGPLSSWLPSGRECPDCKRPQEGAWLCSECAEADKKRNREQRIRQSMVDLGRQLPERLMKFARTCEARESVRSKKLLAVCDRYEVKNENLLLLGPSGVGKTLTMLITLHRLTNEVVASGTDDHPLCHAYWTSGLAVARALREQRLGSACDEIDRARRCQLLFLDEVGQEMADPRWLLELLDPRYGSGGVTIVSSGLRRPELEARYGIGALRRFTAPFGWTLDLFGETA
jgi:DNA replication protein DnaC